MRMRNSSSKTSTSTHRSVIASNMAVLNASGVETGAFRTTFYDLEMNT